MWTAPERFFPCAAAVTQPSYGIGFYSPAGFTTDPAAIVRAVSRLEAAGHRVVVDATVASRWQRFSAPDDERLAAIVRMASDPNVDIAIAVRGGYGWSRLLDRIDFGAVAAAGKWWLGHSDFTAFQLPALAHEGMVTFAGPMAAYDFGAEAPSAFTSKHCWGLLAGDQYTVDCKLDGPAPFHTEGILWGGNLAMLSHLVGTAHFPDIDGGILFIEDTGEHPYRIERMLYQLHFAGVLERQRAVLLGDFSGFELGANDNGYDIAAMIEHARSRFGVPVFTGLPFGHCRDKLTLPMGGLCRLTVREGVSRLTFSRYKI
jgi:muramoyltetrapeptide carboxypeptidase